MALYLANSHVAALYQQQAKLSRDAIDRSLWNETAEYYIFILGGTGYGLMDIAQALLVGIGSKERRTRCVEKLSTPRVPAGYIHGTRFFDAPGIVNPYNCSLLLEGLAVSNRAELAQELLDATWDPMARRDRNYTGGYWKYIVSFWSLRPDQSSDSN